MSRIFVTASGTEVGKTFVTCSLISQLRHAGRSVQVLKPVATGFGADEPSDSEILLNALGRDANSNGIAEITPWRFKEPLSPDMAAAREQVSIPFEELVAFCKLRNDSDVTLIEGIGGVMVPLNEHHTVLDWIDALGAPTLLVVGGYLGTLSHTLTALGVLQARDIDLAGIIVNESREQPVTVEETAEAIARFAGSIPIRVVHRVAEPADAPDLLPLVTRY